jgi:CRP-like cAMP-binding protein
MRQIIGYMERREFETGEYVMQLGDEADDLCFLESGQVTSQIEQPGQKSICLETMRGGRTVGELGLYLGAKRSADVIANEATITYRLTRAALESMEHSDPPAALVFHRLIVYLLGERTIHLMRLVHALQRWEKITTIKTTGCRLAHAQFRARRKRRL